jgi:hypothetical protein
VDVIEWIEHRMLVLEIEGARALAELADLGDETLEDLWGARTIDALTYSQSRRLAWSLQVSLRKLRRLDWGELGWIEDDDRYFCDVGWRPAGRLARADDDEQWRSAAAAHEERRGTPVIARLDWVGRIEGDDCWDAEWGRRLDDGEPLRRDVYAVETELAGEYVVLRNAGPWEVREGSLVALYAWNGFEGEGFFGQLAKGKDGKWRVIPRHAEAIEVSPEDVCRVGRVIKRWPPQEGSN